MHDCPVCQGACDCDGEDTWLNAPPDCDHCDGDEYDFAREADYEDELEDYDYQGYDPADYENSAVDPTPYRQFDPAAYKRPGPVKRLYLQARYWLRWELVSICPFCHRPQKLFGREVGDHFNCYEVPF